MNPEPRKPRPGEKVVLTSVPPGLLRGLPTEDQEAISQIVGKPVTLLEYDADGRAELEFVSADGHIHSIWVDPRFIEMA